MTMLRNKGRWIVHGLIVVLLLSVFSMDADAQKKKHKKGSSGVIRLEETVIEGQVAKPNAFFINTRQALVYDSMEVRESFVKEIKKAVKSGPF